MVVSTSGIIDTKVLETMTLDDGVEIIKSLKDAAVNSGAVDPVMGAQINALISQIEGEDSLKSLEKIKKFLNPEEG